jgi:hypothetical protein
MILSGGNDKIILAFTPESSESIFSLSGHENTGKKQETVQKLSYPI